MKTHYHLGALLLFLVTPAAQAADEPGTKELPNVAAKRQWRQPVALALAANRWLFIANERSGSISVLDVESGQVVREVQVGKQLVDLRLTSDIKSLVVLDGEAAEAILFRHQDGDLTLLRRFAAPTDPRRLDLSADGKQAVITGRWSRTLGILDLLDGGLKTIPLSFAPQEVRLLPGADAIAVADAFGGRLAVCELTAGTPRVMRELPGHNVRGLALRGEQLFVTHQVLSRLARTTFDDVHWGNLLTNNVRELHIPDLLNPKADPVRTSRLHQVGTEGQGSGDPAGVACLPDGRLLIVLSGTDQVAFGPGAEGEWRRLAVGRRPTAVVVSSNGRRAYVANTFGDSISVVDVERLAVVKEITLGPTPEPDDKERGRRLFFNARLSHDGWLSCHSCHTDGHTSELLADTHSDGSFGTPKRVLSLLGVAETGPWGWNGSFKDLRSQIRQSISSTMQGGKPSDQQVRDLEAFLRTLPMPRATLSQRESAGASIRGAAVFAEHGCRKCHAPPTYTTSEVYDVGLADEAGLRQLNPPSLRGVGLRSVFLHDNRTTSLAEAVRLHQTKSSARMSDKEMQDLLTFLKYL